MDPSYFAPSDETMMTNSRIMSDSDAHSERMMADAYYRRIRKFFEYTVMVGTAINFLLVVTALAIATHKDPPIQEKWIQSEDSSSIQSIVGNVCVGVNNTQFENPVLIGERNVLTVMNLFGIFELTSVCNINPFASANQIDLSESVPNYALQMCECLLPSFSGFKSYPQIVDCACREFTGICENSSITTPFICLQGLSACDGLITKRL